MDKILKPEKLQLDPNSADASKGFKHWKRCFESYFAEWVTVTSGNAETKKLQALINLLSCDIYEFIDECETYAEAIEVFQKVFVKAPSEIYGRYKLSSSKSVWAVTSTCLSAFSNFVC